MYQVSQRTYANMKQASAKNELQNKKVGQASNS